MLGHENSKLFNKKYLRTPGLGHHSRSHRKDLSWDQDSNFRHGWDDG